MDTLKLAVIGCGAVAERVHLPAVARSASASATVLVDRSDRRARELAATFGVARVATDFRDVIGQVDAAIVGVPHQLHAPIATDLLEAGIHVLVEKPMALVPADCARMNDAARRSGAVLAVGLLRRCAPALGWVKRALDAGMLGRVLSFDLREGARYSWPVASPAMFRPGGGGVLADAGAHVLDLVLWWFGSWHRATYLDDARGGVEADCLIELQMAGGVRGRVELSRTRNLANTCTIHGERGTLVAGTKTDSIVSVQWQNGEALSGRPTRASEPSPTSLVELFSPQLEQFVRAIRFAERPVADGIEGARSIELMAACYAARQPWLMPWDAPVTAPLAEQVAS